MPRGAGPEREREYKELVQEFEEKGRYEGREEEVAARIVNKQRAQHGETREAREEDRQGTSPDRDLPIKNYDQLTVEEITRQLGDLSENEIQEIKAYEQDHNSRKTLIEALDRRLEDGRNR